MATTENTGISGAVAAAGSQEKLAAALGCSQQLVSRWELRGWVPPLRALEIETLFGTPRASLVHPRLVDLLRPAAFDREE